MEFSFFFLSCSLTKKNWSNLCQFSNVFNVQILVLFLKTCLKSKTPKPYGKKPKKYKEEKSDKEENKKPYSSQAPDRYETKMDIVPIDRYGSAKDLFAHAFSFGKRNRH